MGSLPNLVRDPKALWLGIAPIPAVANGYGCGLAIPNCDAAHQSGRKSGIEGLLERIDRDARQGVLCQPGVDQGLAAAILVALLELLAGVAAQARAGGQIVAEPTPVLEDRRQPAARAPARLILVLQQVLENDDQVAFDLHLLVNAQAFDLVDQIADVELLQLAFLEQPDLLFDPQAEVALVERLSASIASFARAMANLLDPIESSTKAGLNTRASGRRGCAGRSCRTGPDR
jgi:hypothetical protein